MRQNKLTQEEKLERMDLAAKQDRERFFAVADTLSFQPKYAEYFSELSILKQTWRDMTSLENWPEVDWPLELPEWFPAVKFASCWTSDYAVEAEEVMT